MFSKRIINTAKFLKMPVSTQCLYFHLGLQADDDGVVEAYTVMNQTGATEDDLKILVAKGFVIVLNDDLVTYITDWQENNKIRADRKVDTVYKDLLLQMLPDVELTKARERDNKKRSVRTTNGQPNDNQMTTNGQPNDNQMTTNGQPMDAIGKDRLGKYRLGINNPPISPLKGESCEVTKPKTEKKPKGKAIYKDLPDELKDAMIDFEEMRTKMRKPLTDRGRKLLITKLTKLASDDNGNIDTQLAVKIVEQSLERSWASFYEIKSDNGSYQGKTNNSDTLPYSGLDW